MVSIEKIQEKNNLSGELQKHGFALDSGEALQQAEKIYNKQKKDPEVKFGQTSEAPAEKEVTKDEQIKQLKQRVHKLERKNKYEKDRCKELQDQLSEVTGKVNDMISSIKRMEMNQESFQRQLNKVDKQESSGSDDSSQKEDKKQEQQNNSQQNKGNQGNAQEPGGEYSQEDVAVENIFYSADQ